MNRILIVEDDEVICSLLSDILKVYGEVTEAHNIIETQSSLTNKTFDLAIVDYYLGDTNGLEIVKLIQSQIGQIPIILISAYPTIDMLKDSLELKINSFLRKPIDYDDLTKKVESILICDSFYVFNEQRIIMMRSSLKVQIDSEEYDLTETQFKIMNFFLEQTDKSIEREKIVEILW